MNEDKNFLAIHEKNLDKKTLKDKINEALVLNNSAVGKDNNEMVRKRIVYSKMP